MSLDVKEGAWNHVAVVWDDVAGSLTVYFNGSVLAMSGTPAAGMMPDLSDVYATLGIGGILGLVGVTDLDDGGESADAEIDELCIWDRALSATEIGLLDGAFSGSPLVQTTAGERAIRVAPSYIKLYLPFDDDGVLDSAPFSDVVVENSAGVSFNLRPLLRTQVDASDTLTTLDLDFLEAESASNKAIDLSKNFDVVSTTNLYKLVCHTGAAQKHRFVRATSYSDANRRLTIESITTVASEEYPVGTSFIQRNLVADGDMENAAVAAIFWASAGTLTKETTIVRQGLRSLKYVTGGAGGTFYQQLEGNDTSSPLSGEATYANTQYVVFFSVYPTDNFTTQTFAWIAAGGAPGGTYYMRTNQHTEDGTKVTRPPADEWSDWCFVAMDAYKEKNDIRFKSAFGSATTSYWDNVSIMPSFVPDGKFESPGDYTTSDLTLTSVADRAGHSGNARGNAALTAASGYLEESFSLGNSTYFVATVYVQANTLDSTGDVKIEVRDGAAVELAEHEITGITTPDTNYHKLSVLFATNTNGTYTVRVTFTGANTDVWYIDDFFIIEMHGIPTVFDPIEESHLLTPTKDTTGLYIMEGSEGLVYSSVTMNPNAFGFVARIRPQYSSVHSSTTGRAVFEFEADANNGVKVEYVSGVWRMVWTAGGSGTNVTASSATFAFDSDLEVSGWVDPDGRSIGGTTYYAKLFVNGTEVASQTGSVDAMEDHVGTLYIGTNKDQNLPAYAVLDELYLFVQAVTDNELIGFYTEQEPLHNDNKAITINQSVGSGDWIRVDTQTMTAEYYDENTRTRASLGASTGSFPALAPLPSRKGWVLVSDTTKETRVGFRKEWL